jgi:hypothetical protein
MHTAARPLVLLGLLLAIFLSESIANPLISPARAEAQTSVEFDTGWRELEPTTSGLDALMVELAPPIAVPAGKIAYVEAQYGFRYRAIAQNGAPDAAAGFTFVSTFDYSLGLQVGTTMCGQSIAGSDGVPFVCPTSTWRSLTNPSLDHQVLLHQAELPGWITGPYAGEVRLEARFYGGLWVWDGEVVSQNSSHQYLNSQGHLVAWQARQDNIAARLRGRIYFVDA